MTDTMTPQEYRDFIAKQGGEDRRRVQGAKRVQCQGQTFHSIRERDRWLVLRDEQKRGRISDLRRQVPFPMFGKDGPILTPTGQQMRYIADFVYLDHRIGVEPVEVVEDAKGWATDVFKIKKAILAAQGVEVTET
ncbi:MULTISPECIES: DUF1064 domain-containing protein [unclassified Mameliella]|uniref:DUF1064 domain-containing protein n=1 Tax=unclassified Mameliella TaxID=2630630 RepID=UPI00273E10B3|nr:MULTISPECIES: DUF1064 domain-containing protein [unclassified Mameliella]